MEFGLNPEDIKKIQGVFAKYPQVTSAILYGSRAKEIIGMALTLT